MLFPCRRLSIHSSGFFAAVLTVSLGACAASAQDRTSSELAPEPLPIEAQRALARKPPRESVEGARKALNSFNADPDLARQTLTRIQQQYDAHIPEWLGNAARTKGRLIPELGGATVQNPYRHAAVEIQELVLAEQLRALAPGGFKN